MSADPYRATRMFERAMIANRNGSLCGVVLDSETAAWADALPSIPFVVDPLLADGIVQMRDRSGRVVAELVNIGDGRRDHVEGIAEAYHSAERMRS